MASSLESLSFPGFEILVEMLQVRPIDRNDEDPLSDLIEGRNDVKRSAADPVQKQGAGEWKAFGIVLNFFTRKKRCQHFMSRETTLHNSLQRMALPFNAPVSDGALQSFSIQCGLLDQCAQSMSESQFRCLNAQIRCIRLGTSLFRSAPNPSNLFKRSSRAMDRIIVTQV